ncbi:MAG: hypothetical protein V7724_02025 [Sediminicola sp.]
MMKKHSYYTVFLFLITLIYVSCAKNEEMVADPVSPVFATYENGIKMIYRGDDRWSAHVGGSAAAYFSGPPLEELQNGQRSAWQMTTPVGDPLYYERYAISSWYGDGSGFHVTGNCANIAQIKRTIKKVVKNSDGSYSLISGTDVGEYPTTGTCSFTGKIVMDENCHPIVVSNTSIRPNGCMEDINIIPILN